MNGEGATPFEVAITLRPERAPLIAPSGLDTPHGRSLGCEVTGASQRQIREQHTGQMVQILTPLAETVILRHLFTPAPGHYPDAMFAPHPSRFTRAAQALLAEARAVAPGAPPLDRARAIACATAERFTYGHPAARFTDGRDEVPALGCGIAEGSCIDINIYFLASLRAAGIEAGYVTGYFFPAEKGDHCDGMHCWVVTRIDGTTQEWDIAHHLKMGSREIFPGLNPRPGFRVAMAHSMGLNFPSLGLDDLKLIGDPIALCDAGPKRLEAQSFRLVHPDISPVPAS